MTKILLLASCALVIWWLTRPKTRRRKKTAAEKLVHCPRCGVYHETGSNCSCDKNT